MPKKQPIDYLLTRRSVKAKELSEPAPSKKELEVILRAATRVPDHGKLAPWRIKVVHKNGQKKLGKLFAKRFAELNPKDATEKHAIHEQERATRAPLLLVVLSTPVESIKAPLWEQHMSVGAVCMNILHAANMLGYSANWLTEWPAFDYDIKQALGGKDEDKIAGFIYIGTASEKPEERERPNLKYIVSTYD